MAKGNATSHGSEATIVMPKLILEAHEHWILRRREKHLLKTRTARILYLVCVCPTNQHPFQH